MSVQDCNPDLLYFSAIQTGLVVTTQQCPERPYVSLPLNIANSTVASDFPINKSTIAQGLSVRRIVFTTVSHDQGFSENEDRDGGTYRGTFTWFEARVITPSGYDRVLSRRHIQHNVLTRYDFKTHVNTWDYSEQRDVDDNPEDMGLSLHRWMDVIRLGDTIQIIHKAHFPQWANFVQEAKIEVWAVPILELPDTQVVNLVDDIEHHQYRQLHEENREIRVVDLQPSDDEEKPVQLLLRHTTLSGCKVDPRYDALSYCWGGVDEDIQPVQLTSVNDEGVDIQGRSSRQIWIPVSQNLFLALKRLRYKDSPRTIWIDQICINQADAVERASQIALMGDIYASAQTVCVWLGESDRAIEKDSLIISTISKHYEPTSHDADKTPASTQLTHGIIKNPAAGFFTLHHDKIFIRPWFERVWVLQEVWNASSIQVLCGSHQLRWDEFMQAHYCLKNHGIFASTISRVWNVLFDVSRDGGVMTHKPETNRLDILRVLIAAHEMKATDPRDKIFALLIFGRETQDLATLPAEIRPDYHKEAIDVYADFTRWWILHYRSLRILSAVHTLHGRTWVNGRGAWP
ncbi:heterokaryon incompatibility protein-domain-containing protein [Whalleya microplaca]|nr:heterokaryon incompatibility protein-domain-containing protein [Whalleya microplaca]